MAQVGARSYATGFTLRPRRSLHGDGPLDGSFARSEVLGTLGDCGDVPAAGTATHISSLSFSSSCFVFVIVQGVVIVLRASLLNM